MRITLHIAVGGAAEAADRDAGARGAVERPGRVEVPGGELLQVQPLGFA